MSQTPPVSHLDEVVSRIALRESLSWKNVARRPLPKPGSARLDPNSLQSSAPPFAVHPHFVGRLRWLATLIKKESGVSHRVALEFVATRAGFDHWKHVTTLAKEYARTVIDTFETGCVALLQPPKASLPHKDRGQQLWRVEDRLLFEAARNLQDHFGEENDAGWYGACSPSDFLRLIGANEYSTEWLGPFYFCNSPHALARISGIQDVLDLLVAAFGQEVLAIPPHGGPHLHYVWVKGQFFVINDLW